MMKKHICLLFIISLFVFNLQAEVRLPDLFSDNMMIQRDQPVKIWGWADKGEKVEITFQGKKVGTKADKAGYWSLVLQPHGYGGPYSMQVEGSKNKIGIDNILIGDIWLCSGQSNMEMTVNGWAQVYDYEKEIVNANYPLIRTFNVTKDISVLPKSDLKGNWLECSPQTASDFSATAYFFARKLYQELGIPIGIVNSSWGGTDIETWISKDSFKQLPQNFKQRYAHVNISDNEDFFVRNEANKKAYYEALKNDRGLVEQWYTSAVADAKDWKKIAVPQRWSRNELSDTDGYVWFRCEVLLPESVNGKGGTLNLGQIDDNDVSWVNGVKVGETEGYNVNRNYKLGANLLKAGKNTITVKVIDNAGEGGMYGSPDDLYVSVGEDKYPISGEWLHKPSVTNTAYNYVEFSPNSYSSLLYNGMINPLLNIPFKGVIWYQGENNANAAYDYRTLFPALINDWRAKWNRELPFYWVQLANFMSKDAEPKDSEWAELREAQDLTLALPHTGQAVITDIGDGNDIHPRNKQDVGIRLALIALNKDYEKGNVYSGPRFETLEIEGNKAIVHFDCVADGLNVNNKYGYIEGFAIAGSDRKFVWAKAELKGNTIVLSADNVTQPVAVRYSWSNNPDVNLYNSKGLPAVPFRTDRWKIITQK